MNESILVVQRGGVANGGLRILYKGQYWIGGGDPAGKQAGHQVVERRLCRLVLGYGLAIASWILYWKALALGYMPDV